MLGLPFTVCPADIDETPQAGLTPKQVAEDLAVKKASVVARSLPPPASRYILAADTVVVPGGQILGKPENRDEAGRMLRLLADRKHEVITAMALLDLQNKKTDCRSVSCEVLFAPLSDAEIEWYLDTGEWEGAAGAYRLQSLGGCLIKKINGSPSAVAGLPLHEFYVMLRDNGYQFGA